MSQQRIDAIRHALDRGNQGDLSALRDLCADDVTAEAGSLWPVGGVAHGPDEIIRAFESMIGAFERVRSTPDEFIEVRDSLVVPLTWRGVPRGSSVQVEQRVVGAFTFRGPKLVRLAYFSQIEEALADVARQPDRHESDQPKPR